MLFATCAAISSHPELATSYPLSLKKLLRDADEALSVPRISVIDNPALPVSGDPHDYYSIAPYCHPNPDTADGLPYVYRDGVYNPEFFDCDRPRMDRFCKYIRKLTLAYLATKNECYRAHAVKLLRCFFVDEETRMNPHLEYAQGTRGKSTGSAYGIIDLRYYYRVLDMVRCLGDADLENDLRPFFSGLCDWLLTSEKGIEEAAHANNHGTWYDVTTAAIAHFVGRDEVVRELFSSFTEKRLIPQISDNGACPHETKRTRAYLYSTMNLFGYYLAARMARQVGIDLFADGLIKRATEFMLPYYADFGKWPFQQIDKVTEEVWEMAYELLYVAAAEFGMPECIDAAEHILKTEIPDSDIPFLRPTEC